MSEYPYRTTPRPRPRSKGRRLLKLAAGLVAVGVVFALGVALGEALNDGPARGRTVTYVRTLTPLPQQPATVAR